MLSSPKPIPFSADPAELAAAPALEPGFRELFIRNPLPMWIFESSSLRFLAVNDAAVQRYGWTREEFLAMTADQVRPDADVAAFLEYRRKVEFGVEAGLKPGANWRHVTKSGEIIAV